MSAINFVVRDGAGNIQRGILSGDRGSDTIEVGSSQDISLNLRRSDIASFGREGSNLIVTLTDGTQITLDGYFTSGVTVGNQLFLSDEGFLTEVQITEEGGDKIAAYYQEAEVFGKWSPNDDLFFTGANDYAVADAAVTEPEASMLGTALLTGLGGLGSTAGLGAAALVGGVALLPDGDDGADTTAPDVAVTGGTESVGHVVNADDYSDGVDISGTGEPGASIVVTVEGVDAETTVAEDGTWTVTFDDEAVAGGEYTTPVTVVATDEAGNATTITDTLVIDTVAHVTMETDTVEMDGIVNAEEASDGVTITGTAEAGSTVVVQLGDVTHDATVAADGTWTVDFAASEIPGGEYDATVVATATDAYGNSASTSSTLQIDTQTSIEFTSLQVAGDNIVNASELQSGVTLTGTSQPGSTVSVDISGITYAATVAADGSWSVTYPASDFVDGEYEVTAVATTTDAAGNTATANHTFQIDTITDVSVNTATVEGEGVVNFTEHSDGVTLTGTAEPGASVVVTLGSVSHTVMATAGGTWSADFASFEIPQGEYTAPVQVVATDANGNQTSTTSSIEIDTYVNNLTTTSQIGGDNVINAAEAQSGVSLTGTVEAGSSVLVTLAGVTLPATVAADGSWSVNFGAGQIPSGEYTTSMTIVATDAAGNTSELSEQVTVDTDAGYLTLSSAPIETDDLINAVEASDGVVITGTATPGATVEVTLGGVTHTTVSNAAGQWTTTYAPGEVAPGTYTSEITASTTDAAGNSLSVADSVQVDTVVDNLAIGIQPVEGDNIISGAEAADGVVLTGTSEVGSTVVVQLGIASKTVVTGPDGTWSASFAASEIPQGENLATMTATATDLAGNVDDVTGSVLIDTIVSNMSISDTPVTGDDLVGADDMAAGVTLTGTTEVGSSVMVTVDGVAMNASVDANGNWSVTYPAGSIAEGEYTAQMVVTATDAVGNTKTLNDSFVVDTTAPDAPVIRSFTREVDGVWEIGTELTDETFSITEITADGQSNPVTYTTSENTNRGRLDFEFNEAVPDGSQLVVSAADEAGNQNSTLLVLDDVNTDVVNLNAPGLDNFDIGAINLALAENADLTLTAADLEGLSDHSNEVRIHGGEDDTVTIAGAIATGETETINGQTYDVYSLGDEGGSLIINEDINVII
ncbi:Ig-like domain-containing protein [Nereida sp. MMG025]|uniref:Ig-like domain-containing protein n=1 Tax=Nereida sp. MMG025 TaxID=2909981 RepID=UPI001F289B26|nr:Ig-like domain-containing protein [Nereida sp. MMG025]MCF6444598.1 Ig-like domain-containing protein [Nereida sp. MMG025]